MAALIRIAIALLALGCTREHPVDFQLVLTPGCSCAGPGSISLSAGAKVGFFARKGVVTVSGACVEVSPGAGSAEDVLPSVLDAVELDRFEEGETLSFMLRVARPSAELACEPDGQEVPPLILFGESSPVELTGDPPPIAIGLSCLDAC